jgi:hypothetical protein
MLDACQFFFLAVRVHMSVGGVVLRFRMLQRVGDLNTR